MSSFGVDKTITLDQLLTAMEKNGYKQSVGKLFEYDGKDVAKDNIVAACALGQAMLNLDVGRITSQAKEQETGVLSRVVKAIGIKNDVEGKTPDIIAQEIRKEFQEYLGIRLDCYFFSNPKSMESYYSLR